MNNDRLAQIKARDTTERWESDEVFLGDIAWLIGEVERLRGALAALPSLIARAEIERLNTEAEGDTLRAEIERLHADVVSYTLAVDAVSTERDEARAALARVETLCNEKAPGYPRGGWPQVVRATLRGES